LEYIINIAQTCEIEYAPKTKFPNYPFFDLLLIQTKH
jgi:hypothetical protein